MTERPQTTDEADPIEISPDAFGGIFLLSLLAPVIALPFTMTFCLNEMWTFHAADRLWPFQPMTYFVTVIMSPSIFVAVVASIVWRVTMRGGKHST